MVSQEPFGVTMRVCALLALLCVGSALGKGSLCVRQSESMAEDHAALRDHMGSSDAEPEYVIEDEAEAVARAKVVFLQTQQMGDDWTEDKAQCTVRALCICVSGPPGLATPFRSCIALVSHRRLSPRAPLAL